MRKKAIATVCMSGSLPDKLTAAAEAGYRRRRDLRERSHLLRRQPEDVRELAASLGLEIIALQPFRDFEGLPEPLRARAFDRAKRKFELMNRLGTPLLLVCSSISPDAIDDMARVAADLNELGELARRIDVTVGFEALCWGRHIFDYRQAWEAVRRADHPNVGLILDTFHALGPQMPDRAHRGHPARADRARADRRRAGDRDGPPVPEPALPLLPRPGRSAGDRDDAQAGRDRLPRPDQPRGLQRRLPRKLAAPGRHRRHALLPMARRADRRPPGEPARCPASTASSSSSSSTRPTSRASCGRCCRRWASAAAIATAPRRWSSTARAASTSS